MKPDLTNEHGIAAMFVATSTLYQHGMNYILATDGTGQMVENEAGAAAWRSFDALPAGVDIADVADWTPWTLYTQAGVWYFRSGTLNAWETAATGSETRPETVPARKPVIETIEDMEQ